MLSAFIAGYVGCFALVLLFVSVIARKLGTILFALVLLAICAGAVLR